MKKYQIYTKSFGFRFQMQVNLHYSTEGFCSAKETQSENHFGLSITDLS